MNSINCLTSRPLLFWHRFSFVYSICRFTPKQGEISMQQTSPVYSHVAGNLKSHLVAPVMPQWLKSTLPHVFKEHPVLSNSLGNDGWAIDKFLWSARTPHFAVIQRHNYCLLWGTQSQDMQHAPWRAACGLRHTLIPSLGLSRIRLIRYSGANFWRTDAAESEKFRYWE
jgi:hypothetical protein